MNPPRVSVVMPVYNASSHLHEAIESILRQTFRDFEFVVINDGSSDNSDRIIRSYADPRIRLVHHDQNLGLARVRNRGIDEAQGEFIAWLDADDLSLPQRLEKQVRFLDANPHIALCGTWVRTLGAADAQEWHYPSDVGLLRCRMLFDDPLATSSVMVRRRSLTDLALRFEEGFPPAEDYDLWERFSRHWPIGNLDEVLTLYRVHDGQTSVKQAEAQKEAVWRIQKRLITMLGLQPSEDEKAIHLDIGARWRFDGSHASVERSRLWLERLACANKETCLFPEPAFAHVLYERWFAVCRAAAKHGLYAWTAFRASFLSECAWFGPLATTRLLIRSALRLSPA